MSNRLTPKYRWVKNSLIIIGVLIILGVIAFRAYLYWEIKEATGVWECRGEEYIDERDGNAKRQEQFNLELKQNFTGDRIIITKKTDKNDILFPYEMKLSYSKENDKIKVWEENGKMDDGEITNSLLKLIIKNNVPLIYECCLIPCPKK